MKGLRIQDYSKKYIIMVFLMYLSSILYSQNLINNGSFENPDTCEFYMGILSQVYPDWDHDIGTPDPFHSCWNGVLQPYIPLTTPNSFFGYQSPRTGQGYIGASYCEMGPDLDYINMPTFPLIIGEHLQAKLDTNLVKNKEYCYSYWMSLANNSYLASDSFQIIFSKTDTLYDLYFNSNLDSASFRDSVYAIVDGSGYLADTINWTQFSGSFIAKGYERYISTGRISIYPNTPILVRPIVIPFFMAILAYYYTDDIALWDCDTIPPTAEAGKDTLICQGDSVKIGSHNYPDYFYKWTPDSTVSFPTQGLTYVKPDTTTTYYLETTDFRFVKTLDSVMVLVKECEPDAIDDFHLFNVSIKIYPNPAYDDIIIDMSRNSIWNELNRFTIQDLSGRIVYSSGIKEFGQKENVEIGYLSSGIYIVSFYDVNLQKASKKLIISR